MITPPGHTPSWQAEAVIEVLFVCTGNVCRSPCAQFLTRRLMLDRLGPPALDAFAFASAGIRAVPGRPIHPDTRAALAAWGVDDANAGPGTFASRRLDEKMLIQADLILTAEESHRSAIAWMMGEATPKVYSLRRFARMLQALDQRRLPAEPTRRALQLMEWAPTLHASIGYAPPDDDAVPDPINGDRWDHLRAADLVYDAVATFVDVVAPVPFASP